MTFQELIFALDRYWAKQGCAVRPGGAELALSSAPGVSVAGPLWLPAADGRRGQYRYQALLRPAPADARGLFLGAMKRAGIDRAEHDLRWLEAGRRHLPSGLTGTGWEVLLDGLHLARFIYLLDGAAAQGAWLDLSLERLALAAQRKPRAAALAWSAGLSYGELHGLPAGEER